MRISLNVGRVAFNNLNDYSKNSNNNVSKNLNEANFDSKKLNFHPNNI